MNRVGNLTRLIHTLLYDMAIHTCVHRGFQILYTLCIVSTFFINKLFTENVSARAFKIAHSINKRSNKKTWQEKFLHGSNPVYLVERREIFIMNLFFWSNTHSITSQIA